MLRGQDNFLLPYSQSILQVGSLFCQGLWEDGGRGTGGSGPTPGAGAGLGPRRSEGLGEGHISVESGFLGVVTVNNFLCTSVSLSVKWINN